MARCYAPPPPVAGGFLLSWRREHRCPDPLKSAAHLSPQSPPALQVNSVFTYEAAPDTDDDEAEDEDKPEPSLVDFSDSRSLMSKYFANIADGKRCALRPPRPLPQLLLSLITGPPSGGGGGGGC